MSSPALLHMTAPSREDFDVPYHDFGPSTEAPRVALVAGLHGDELNGVFVLSRLASFLRRVAHGERPGSELRGRVVVIPAVNVLGVNVRTRNWPFDGTDMNRMFPGFAAGETTREDVRKETAPKKAGRPKNFVWQVRDKSLPFSFNLSFRKANVDKREIAEALRELLRRLERDS